VAGVLRGHRVVQRPPLPAPGTLGQPRLLPDRGLINVNGQLINVEDVVVNVENINIEALNDIVVNVLNDVNVNIQNIDVDVNIEDNVVVVNKLS
jgi:hypothetical protein